MSEKSERAAKGRSPLKIVLIVLICILAFIVVLLSAARAYFRLPVREYYKNSEKTFVIPGLSEGMVVQGLEYDKENGWFAITGYRTDGKASQVSFVEKSSGNEIKRLNLLNPDGSDFTGHVGGIAIHGGKMYIADSQGLVVYNYNDVTDTKNGEGIKAEGVFSTRSENDGMGVAFVYAEGDSLYVGEFHREPNYTTPDSHKHTTAAGDSNTALILLYNFDNEAEFGISPEIKAAYSVPSLVQGMCMDGSGRIYLSTSYGSAFSHVYVYGSAAPDGMITVLDQEVPLYVLDSSVLSNDIKLPPMSEEIVIVDGKLYTMCESATDKYIFGKLTDAKYCYATDIKEY